MATMTKEELAPILTAHQLWLRGEGGERADLYGANLEGADLRGADLRGADLQNANLEGADLRGANLYAANLRGANLLGTNLLGTNLWGTKLTDTVLDPALKPNGDVAGFTVDGDRIIGYRTRRAGHIDQYQDGCYYSADIFSCCPETECHPGLYFWSTPGAARSFFYSVLEIIKISTEPKVVHHVGTKWRCRWFQVLGTAGE